MAELYYLVVIVPIYVLIILSIGRKALKDHDAELLRKCQKLYWIAILANTPGLFIFEPVYYAPICIVFFYLRKETERAAIIIIKIK